MVTISYMMSSNFLFACVIFLFANSNPVVDAFAIFASTRRYVGQRICRMIDADEVTVMVNGLPGPMAMETAKACIDRGLKLALQGLTGPDMKPGPIVVQVTPAPI